MSEKTLAVIIRQPLKNFAKIEEGIRFAVAAASKDISVDLMFVQDGTELLRSSIEIDRMVAFDIKSMLEMLSNLNAVAFVEEESLPESEREIDRLRFEARIIPRSRLSRRLLEKDFIANF